MEFSLWKFGTGAGIGLVTGAINVLLLAGESKAELEGKGCMNGAFALYIAGMMGSPMAMASGEETGAGITVGHEIALHLGIGIMSAYANKSKK